MRDGVVTVFGGSGFIGRHLVERLAEQGNTIRVATRSPERAGDLQPMGNVGQIVPLRCDGRNEAVVRSLCEGADAVINLVGILHESSKGDFEAMHATLPGMIARSCAAAGVGRLVHISAIGADRSSPSLYAQSKAGGEAAVMGAYPDATILRPSIVFGPRDGFFNRFAQMATISPFLPLIGGGKTRFQPVYVGDVADAIMAALDRDDVRGRTFELGGPKVYSFAELLAWILHQVGRRRPLVKVPFGIAMMQARFLELLPTPPLTRDQVELLKRDNVVSLGVPTLVDLGISPTPLEVIVPSYLQTYARQPVRLPAG